MGLAKDYLIEEQNRIEKFYKRDFPDIVYKQEEEIDNLKRQLKENSSFKSKFFDYMIGGLIGAFLGLIISKLF
jgi:hypothetical protein